MESILNISCLKLFYKSYSIGSEMCLPNWKTANMVPHGYFKLFKERMEWIIKLSPKKICSDIWKSWHLVRDSSLLGNKYLKIMAFGKFWSRAGLLWVMNIRQGGICTFLTFVIFITFVSITFWIKLAIKF